MIVRWSVVASVLALAAAAVSCDSSSDFAIVLDLRTDYAPVDEFDAVLVSVEGVDGETRSPARRGEDYLDRVQVALLEVDGAGPQHVQVELRLAGALLAVGDVLVTASASTAAIVTIRRCEQTGSCLAAGCRSSDECPQPPASCATAACVDTLCFEMREACAGGGVCDPVSGCPALLPDAGVDAGVDASADAGPPDAGPGTSQSRVTFYVLPDSVTTFFAVDDTGAPLLIEAAGAFDHDAAGGESVFVSSGPTRLTAGVPMGADLPFVNPTPWLDPAGGALDPDFLFGGALGVFPESFVGTFGSEARTYGFVSGRFGDVSPMLDEDGSPFVLASGATVDLGLGSTLIALEVGSPTLYSFDSLLGRFGAIPGPLVTCAASTIIEPSLVVGATLDGFTPPGGAESMILVEGSDAFVLLQITPSVCFSDAVPLVDEAGVSLAPEIAYGIDFDEDGDDDLVLIDTVTR